MHVRLQKDIADKLLTVSGRTGRSVNEVVNLVLGQVDIVEIVEHTKITVKLEKGQKVYDRRRRYVIDL